MVDEISFLEEGLDFRRIFALWKLIGPNDIINAETTEMDKMPRLEFFIKLIYFYRRWDKN